MACEGGQGFAFLYQSERGMIGAATWMRSAGLLASIFIVLTAIWIALKPFATRSLDQRRFFDPAALAANAYLLVYALAVMLLAISWVNLTAKRLRDRGRAPPVGLAGVLPLVALLDGAVRWLQPQLADALPYAWVYIGDAAVLVALAWTVAECTDRLPRARG